MPGKGKCGAMLFWKASSIGTPQSELQLEPKCAGMDVPAKYIKVSSS